MPRVPVGGQPRHGGEVRSWARCWASPGCCGATGSSTAGAHGDGRRAQRSAAVAARWGTWLRNSMATAGRKVASPSVSGGEGCGVSCIPTVPDASPWSKGSCRVAAGVPWGGEAPRLLCAQPCPTSPSLRDGRRRGGSPASLSWGHGVLAGSRSRACHAGTAVKDRGKCSAGGDAAVTVPVGTAQPRPWVWSSALRSPSY